MSDSCCAHDDAVPADDRASSWWRIREVRVAGASGALLLAALIADATTGDGATNTLFIAALVVGGSAFVPQSLRVLFRGRLGVGTLMTIAAIGAVCLGELGEAASLAFLFSISEALEGYAITRTRRGLRALLALVPERVIVRREGIEAEINPDELQAGDIMIVGPGDRLATDGIVRRGRSTLDLSAITGESVPVEVETDSEVYASSINGGGVLDVEVIARTTESSLARVVHIVEEAQERKGHSQRLAERIARPLVPGIMIIAAAIALIGSIVGNPNVWIGRALVVLVAAAPCAFAIAVPVTVVASVGAAAKMGALIKGGAALESLAGVRIVAFDKTGTLTRNKPTIFRVVTTGDSDRQTVLRVAAALEAHSEHPLAAAILAGRPDGATEASDVQAITANGITGIVDGAIARLGRPGFVEAGALADQVAALQSEGSTVVLVEHEGRLLGAVAVRDELRPEASDVIHKLRRLGIGRVALLTGDNRRTAIALGAAAGIDDIHAELRPEDKVRIIEKLRARGSVAMVGDGINDAPALATADVGLAMGALGSEVAIEAADVALMGESLTHLPEILGHARHAGRIMRQNLLLSSLIIGVLIPLAAFGILGLAGVIATHELAEVLVIANGIRAGRRVTTRPGPSKRPLVDSRRTPIATSP